MSRTRRTLVAICSACAIAVLWVAVAPAGPAEFARYQQQELNYGAVTLRVAAVIEYQYALDAIERGERDNAATHLQNALQLRPRFADAHFTLARVRAREMNPEAVYHFVQGVVIAATTFESQRFLAINSVVTLALVLILASGIVWIALAVRYFPFIAHSVAEMFKERFDAVGPRMTALLVILTPFALFPGFATAAAMVMLLTWPFMQRRERVMSMVIMASFAALAWFAPVMDRYSTVADPNSLVSLIARANDSPADEALTRALANARAEGLEAERQAALGLLATRAGDTENAAAHFLRSISIKPGVAISYINLGNVYYLNGQYVKALEGYRKAEQADSTDAVAQYNLAQAYIKTLLMSESSRALNRASQLNVEGVIGSIARPARDRMPIYPRPYSSGDLWHMAGIEGRHHNPALLTSVIASVTGQSARISFWIAAVSLVLVVGVQRLTRPGKLAFQCANCGDLTCDGCCQDARGSVICQTCNDAVVGVSSDKVLDALLRQRRQSVVIKRRRSTRWLTIWVPGLRHIFFGRFARGFFIATVFSFSALMLWTRGYLVPDWNSLSTPTPLWKWIVPGLGVAISYWVALTANQRYEVRNTRIGTSRPRNNEPESNKASA
ncbi:MAG: tetratricopeptide repeat protein [Candidatus Krumholzibacteria bacterium]|nr:tetratricopeptide repeat protein [Candidatus Krumholzibacteria bacterium]MDH4337486.1 tetratricopeptide repeat protein [Candidatus Krumholzibacteria bacterium]MDH5268301.1 tetratricopeptide repeat protein [Candidatus Krumholzibacteria bacterium]